MSDGVIVCVRDIACDLLSEISSILLVVDNQLPSIRAISQKIPRACERVTQMRLPRLTHDEVKLKLLVGPRKIAHNPGPMRSLIRYLVSIRAIK